MSSRPSDGSFRNDGTSTPAPSSIRGTTTPTPGCLSPSSSRNCSTSHHLIGVQHEYGAFLADQSVPYVHGRRIPEVPPEDAHVTQSNRATTSAVWSVEALSTTKASRSRPVPRSTWRAASSAPTCAPLWYVTMMAVHGGCPGREHPSKGTGPVASPDNLPPHSEFPMDQTDTTETADYIFISCGWIACGVVLICGDLLYCDWFRRVTARNTESYNAEPSLSMDLPAGHPGNGSASNRYQWL